jgi:hypothetical protein
VSHKEVDAMEVPEVDMGTVTITDIAEGDLDPPHVSIAVILVMSHYFVPNHTCSMHIYTNLSMSLKIVPTC